MTTIMCIRSNAFRCLLLLAAFTAVVQCQHLFLAGGGLTAESDFFWNKLIQLGGGKGQARIGIITAGREDAEGSAKELKTILMSHGARHVTWIPLGGSTEDGAGDEASAALVLKQSAIFIDDGDAHRLIRLLRNADGSDSMVLAAMREKFTGRGVMSGSGAGAAILAGGPVPISGGSYEALAHGTKVHSDQPTQSGGRRGGERAKKFHGCSYIKSGLGFLRPWIIEPRFNEHSLHGRTIRLLLDSRNDQETPALMGLGLDQEMALAIYRVGSEQEYAEVLGNKGGITIINAGQATYKASPKLDIGGVQITFLTEDDKLILATDEILPATWKADLAGEEWHALAQPSEDIFPSPPHEGSTLGSFNRVAKRLCDSLLSKRITSVTSQTSPRFQVDMDRRSSEAFHNDSPSTSQHLISYARLLVSISEKD